MLLGELRQSVQKLPGIGPATARLFGALGVATVHDLLRLMPRAYEDRKSPRDFASIGYEGIVNTTVTVVTHEYFFWNRRQTLKVIVTDDREPAALVCYGRNFLAKILQPGRRFRLYGKFQRRHGELQSANFTVEAESKPPEEFGAILPIYPLTTGISQKTIRRAVRYSLDSWGDAIEDELPDGVREAHQLDTMSAAVQSLHFPETVDGPTRARRTLAFGELFYLQLIMQRRAASRRNTRHYQRTTDSALADRLIERLPFSLTEDQLRVFGEITRDLARPTAMTRLLQGDVGCGKTLVALLATTLIASAGEQTAIMAPTELLARQQAETAARYLEPLGLSIGFLAGSVASAPRKRLVKAIESGEIDVVVGTHALFSQDVAFHRLGLVVIDEQHRFGVLQRLAIVEKGEAPDLLLMTATPIPRSLALTVFGDLDTSTIRSLPHGRLSVKTHLTRRGNESKVYERVRRELESGHQAYFVYPLIAASEALDLKHAEGMCEALSRRVFPDFTVALIHSRIPEEEKRERMRSFANGTTDILVATSVVEVGVDVPNATCIVIEQAERFGLSTLHQLRGRVGRSSFQSYAFLVYDEEITDLAKRRLMTMKSTTDGFEIAEEDLRIRGPGELTGVQQTGDFELAFADIVEDIDLLTASRMAVRTLLESDPGLLSPEHRPVREVLSRCPPFSDETTQAG